MEYLNRAKNILVELTRVPLMGGAIVWIVATLVVNVEGSASSGVGWQLVGLAIMAFGALALLAYLVARSNEYAVTYYFERQDKREKNRAEQVDQA